MFVYPSTWVCDLQPESRYLPLRSRIGCALVFGRGLSLCTVCVRFISDSTVSTTRWIQYATNATIPDSSCPNVGTGNSASLVACQASCDAQPACNGMNFNPTGPSCYLRQCPNYSPATNTYSGYNVWLKIPPASTQWRLYASNATIPDSSCPNVGIGNSTNLVACQASCDAQSACNGMNFNPTGPSCYLRQCSSYSPATYTSSGYSVWIKIS
ncbi:unnamed protein product [Adineta ricciae]|uniref:Apple domain-containing protein n=1 Tax=Adineta ricciae TaxID=249248 RepID=A0A814WAF7_ADIRI|nr:unnamed protein product [Adineta ricciae]